MFQIKELPVEGDHEANGVSCAFLELENKSIHTVQEIAVYPKP